MFLELKIYCDKDIQEKISETKKDMRCVSNLYTTVSSVIWTEEGEI